MEPNEPPREREASGVFGTHRASRWGIRAMVRRSWPLPLIAKYRPGAMLDDGQHKEQFSNASGGPRSRRHAVSFGASIVAHAAIVALIVGFASPLARAHREWVLAYLVEGTAGISGRGGARGAASGGASMHAESGVPAPPRPVPAQAAPRRHRRSQEVNAEVASIAAVRPVALARPA